MFWTVVAASIEVLDEFMSEVSSTDLCCVPQCPALYLRRFVTAVLCESCQKTVLLLHRFVGRMTRCWRAVSFVEASEGRGCFFSSLVLLACFKTVLSQCQVGVLLRTLMRGYFPDAVSCVFIARICARVSACACSYLCVSVRLRDFFGIFVIVPMAVVIHFYSIPTFAAIYCFQWFCSISKVLFNCRKSSLRWLYYAYL